MTTTRVRIAAGACMLSTGLLIGSAGGAVAAAAPDRSDSGGSQGSVATKQGSGQVGSSSSLSDALRTSLADATDPVRSTVTGADEEWLGSPTEIGTEAGVADETAAADEYAAAMEATAEADELAAAEAATAAAGESGTDSGNQGESEAEDQAAVTDPATASPGPAVAETAADRSGSFAPTPAGAVTDPATPYPGPGPAETAADRSGSFAPTPAGAGEPQTAPTATDEGAPESGSATPVTIVDPLVEFTGAVVSLGDAVASIPPLIVSLRGSDTPVTDFVTGMEGVLTSVSESVAQLRQTRSDVLQVLSESGLLVGDGQSAPTPAGRAYPAPAPAEAPVPLPVHASVPDWATLPAAQPVSATEFALGGGLATFGLSERAPLPEPPAATDAGSSSGSLMSVLKRAVGRLLLPVSLWTLAAAALPGIGGLLTLSAAGVRVGYRQAKAGLALRTAGLARFAGPGPLGVVRSDSLVVLGPRALRKPKPEPVRFTDRVA